MQENIVVTIDSRPAETGGARVVRTLNDIKAAGRGAGEQIDRTTDSTRKMAQSRSAVDGLANSWMALRRVMAAVGALYIFKEFMRITDAAKQMDAQLRLSVKNFGDLAKAQQDVRRIASATRASFEETTKLYARFMQEAPRLGRTQSDAARATETFAKTLRISGADANTAAAATRQFTQALSRGTLRGDEFVTMLESSDRLTRLLADSLGVTKGQLIQMAAEGEISARKLFDALTKRKFTAEIDREFRTLPVTWGEAMQQIENAAIITFGAFDRGGRFSESIASFFTQGSEGFSGLEADAEAFGAKVAIVFEAMGNLWEPFVNAGKWAFDQLKKHGDLEAATSSAIRNGLNAVLGPAGGMVYDGAVMALEKAQMDAAERKSGLAGLAPLELRNVKTRDVYNRIVGKSELEARIVRTGIGEGTVFTSGPRTASEQRDLIERWERNGRRGPRPSNNTAHFAGAVDTRKSGSFDAAKARIAALANQRGMYLHQALDEPDHWHWDIRRKGAGGAPKTPPAGPDSQRALRQAMEDARLKANDPIEHQYREDVKELTTKFATAGFDDVQAKRMAEQVAAIARDAERTEKAQREQAKTNRELEASYGRINDTLDGFTLRTEELRRHTEDVNKLVAAGKLTKEQGQASIFAKDRDTLEAAYGPMAEPDLGEMRDFYGEFVDGLSTAISPIWEEMEERGRLAVSEIFNDLQRQLGGVGGGLLGLIDQGLFKGELSGRGPSGLFQFLEMGKASAERRPNAVMPGTGEAYYDPMQDPIGRANAGVGSVQDYYIKARADTAGAIRKVFDPVVEKLSKSFPKFGESAGKALAGAQMGQDVDGLMKAFGLKSSKTGAMIGGAIGSALPIPGGQIIGSIAGGIIGGMFKKTPKGSTTLSIDSNGAVTTGNTTGSKATYRQQATLMGTGVGSQLTSIADIIGGELGGTMKVSIGTRKGKFVVDPSGRGRTKGSGVLKFDDEGSAMAAAVRDAIKDGAITGISGPSQRVLRGAKDPATVVNAIAAYEDLELQLLSMTDPTKAAFQGFVENFEKLEAQMRRAGYTTEELAKLEGIYAEQRKELMKEQTAGFRDFVEAITKGPNSGKSIAGQYADAQAKFAGFEAQLARGERVKQDEFTAAGQTLFDLSRQMFGSTTDAFVTDRQRLVDASNRAITNVEAIAPEEMLRAAIDRAGGETVTQLQTANGHLAAIRALLASGGGGSTAPAEGARLNAPQAF